MHIVNQSLFQEYVAANKYVYTYWYHFCQLTSIFAIFLTVYWQSVSLVSFLFILHIKTQQVLQNYLDILLYYSNLFVFKPWGENSWCELYYKIRQNLLTIFYVASPLKEAFWRCGELFLYFFDFRWIWMEFGKFTSWVKLRMIMHS